MQHDRRRLLLAATGLGGMALMTSQALAAPAKKPAHKKPSTSLPAEGANSPPEDLMLEHAVAERLLLVYQEAVRRLQAQEALDARVLHGAAELVRKVVEDYHQKREETHIFPLFDKHAEQADLVKTLRAQHAIGRKLTDKILNASTAESLGQADGRRAVQKACAAYARMYRAHMAWEATELLQVMYEVADEKKVEAIAVEFQRQEQALFGEDSLDKVLDEIAQLEKDLRIESLQSYSPQDA